MRKRRIVLALLAVSGLAMVGTAPAQAVGIGYPYCLQGYEYPALSNCSYTSLEQCQATASGRFLQCMANPYFIPSGYPRGYRGRHRVPVESAY